MTSFSSMAIFAGSITRRFVMMSSALVLLLIVASPGSSTVMDTFTFTGITPTQTATPSAGVSMMGTGSGASYSLGRIDLSGSITEINGTTVDFISDNKLYIQLPNGAFTSAAISSATSYAGTTAFTGSMFFPLPINTSPFGGMIDFRFSNTPDDAPSGMADAMLDITVSFTDEFPTAPTSIDLGTISDTSTTYATPDVMAMHNGGAINWYKFDVPIAVNNGAGLFLDIDTEGSILSDTEIALYNVLGTLLAQDDDDGSVNLSELSYGLTTPTRTIGTAVGGNGRDGALAAGTYYLAVGGFNTTFASGFSATTTSTDTTSKVNVNLRTNVVPEPTTMAFVALGMLGLAATRRK